MDFSFTKNKATSEEVQDHPTPILKKIFNDGAVKMFQDTTGHAERVEILIPEGKVVVIKDYEKLPALAHYKKVIVYSGTDEQMGMLDIVPESRQFIHSNLKFYDGTTPIGTGVGSIGLAIAQQLLPQGGISTGLSNASVDPEVVSLLKSFLKGRS